jgi:site-specific DNA-methyltransferase (adenine-specific)
MSVQLYLGDCLEVLATLPENSVDTCITDPPYELGFMGKKWDSSGIAFQPETWQAVYRVLKPGAILLAFGGTRTYHRLACAIEDAGFEIRDTIAWVYGSGFPKSYDISKGIDKQAGVEFSARPASGVGFMKPDSEDWHVTKNQLTREGESTPEAQLWHGWGTALKPAFEPIVVAMKPIDGTFVNNALTWGVAGLWIDGGRVGSETIAQHGRNANDKPAQVPQNDYHPDKSWQGRFPANFILSYPEDEYELRDDVTPSQLMELARWFDENA